MSSCALRNNISAVVDAATPNKTMPSICILSALLDVAFDKHSQDLVHSCGVIARLSYAEV